MNHNSTQSTSTWLRMLQSIIGKFRQQPETYPVIYYKKNAGRKYTSRPLHLPS